MIKDLIGICSLFEGTITATDWGNWGMIQKTSFMIGAAWLRFKLATL